MSQQNSGEPAIAPPARWLNLRGVLIAVVMLQVAGGCLAAAMGEVSIESWLFYRTPLRDPWLTLVADGATWAGLAAAVAGMLGYRLAWLWVALWFAMDAAIGMTVEVGAFMSLTLPAHAVRIAAPLALFALGDGGVRRREWVLRGLMVATGLTFAAHGLEAYFGHPTFVDYLFVFITGDLGVSVTQVTLQRALVVIGIVDLLVALPALGARRWPVVYAYMGIWGTIAAGSRVVHSGLFGLPDMLIRAANGGVAAAIFVCLWRHDGVDEEVEG